MCVGRAAGSWLGAVSRVWVEGTGLATRAGWRRGGPGLAWPGRCQRAPCIPGWPERRMPINIVHYPGERSVFFIALSSGCNLLVLQFQWLKRRFRSSQFHSERFFFLFFFFLFCVFSWQDFFFNVKLLTECTLHTIVITF